MTDDEFSKLLEEFQATFGDSIKNPLHEPKQFEYQVNLFAYYKLRAKGKILQESK